VLPVIFLAICIASVPLSGGRLLALGDLRFRAAWAIFAAIGIQILIISVVPDALPGVLPFVHISSYLFAGYFIFANRHVPGVWLIGLGGAMNFAAIVANGGTMPASASAMETAGLLKHLPGEYLNSAALGNPSLAFLGDIFAVPKSVPFHNVFSLGDITIALGTVLGMHRICGTRLLPSAEGEFSSLLRQPGFRRVWAGQAASSVGDFVYALAILVSLTAHGAGAQVLATLLIVEVAAAAASGLLASPLIDRFSRKRLMIGTDLLRAIAVLSVLLVPSPSLLHFYVVAGVLGALRAIFKPSLRASLPNLVPKNLLIAANSLVTMTFHIALMAGPAIGGLLAAHFGLKPALAVNMATFIFSASLLTGVRIPRVAKSGDDPVIGELVQGIRYCFTTPLVRGIIAVTGLAMLAAAIKTPLEPLFILKNIGGPPQALGFTEGCWGAGMVLGSIAAPAIARRWQRQRLLGFGFGVIGTAVLVGSQASALFPILVLWLVAGGANAVVNVSYTSLLQESASDRLRGRVVAAAEAALDMAFIAGALLAGWIGSSVGVRPAYVIAGSLMVVTALASPLLLAGRNTARRIAPHPRGGPGAAPAPASGVLES
jgi:predicted MFS family arabinose efflux permease